MKKYVCLGCGYIYDTKQGDPDNGIAHGTLFEGIPDSWVCPFCLIEKDGFEQVEE
ncbi:MAG: rubredoxin [Vulcanibacillus sp.]